MKGGGGGGGRSRARTARRTVVVAAAEVERVPFARGGGGGARPFRPFRDGRTQNTILCNNSDDRTGNSATPTTWHRTVPWKTIDADESVPAGRPA